MTAVIHPQQDMSFATSQTDLPVGEILRRARLQRGLTIEDVEAQLKIKASQVQALEEMNFDAFSGWVYVTGFVKSYADFLGLDGSKVLLLLKNQTGRHHEKQELNIPEPDSETQMPDLWIILSAIGALVLVVIAIIIFQAVTSNSDTPDIPVVEDVPYLSSEIPSPDFEDNGSMGYSNEAQGELDQIVADANIESPVVEGVDAIEEGMSSEEQTGVPVPEPKPDNSAAAPVDSEHRIIINVSEKSWVEIRDQTGAKVVSRVLNPGDSFFVPDDAGNMSMTTGNAAGIDLVVDGASLGTLGQKGEIRKNIPLEPESLKEMFAR